VYNSVLLDHLSLIDIHTNSKIKNGYGIHLEIIAIVQLTDL